MNAAKDTVQPAIHTWFVTGIQVNVAALEAHSQQQQGTRTER